MPDIALKLSSTSAIISTRGAALVSLKVNGLKLAGALSALENETYNGSVLSPWQNRLEAGRWKNRGGNSYQNPINETARGNALHGLLFDQEFEAEKISDSKVLLTKLSEGSVGFPFSYLLQVTYELTDSGLVCSFEVTNHSDTEMPFVIGFHPYLTLGDEVAELTLFGSAKSHYNQNPNKIPVEKHLVAGTKWDISKGIKVGEAGFDDYFTDLEFIDGKAKTRLVSANGKAVELWQDASMKHLIIYTTNEYPGEEGIVSAVAVEPASAPANALATHEDVIWLAEGQKTSGSWGISLADQ